MQSQLTSFTCSHAMEQSVACHSSALGVVRRELGVVCGDSSTSSSDRREDGGRLHAAVSGRQR